MSEADTEPVPARIAIKRLLNDDPEARSVWALGKDAAGRRAVVQLSKPPFTPDEAASILQGEHLGPILHRNDRFSKHKLLVPPALNSVTAMLICPANDHDVTKYTGQTRHLVRETAALFEAVTRPFVEALPAQQLSWVWNILEKKKEAELILDEADGFTLVPDSKWDRADMVSLHYLAIAKDRSLHSLRELRGEHLPMLLELRERCRAAILRKYGLPASAVRAYVHYLPTFWQLHIHFQAITCPGAPGGTCVGKAILFDDVLDNLARDGEYYARAALTYSVGEREPLYAALRAVLPESELPAPKPEAADEVAAVDEKRKRQKAAA